MNQEKTLGQWLEEAITEKINSEQEEKWIKKGGPHHEKKGTCFAEFPYPAAAPGRFLLEGGWIRKGAPPQKASSN